MRRECDGFFAPVPQPEQHADADAPESRGMSAFGTGEAPVVVFLRSGRVQACIGRTVICFLIDHEPFGSGVDQRDIFLGLHRRDLDGE